MDSDRREPRDEWNWRRRAASPLFPSAIIFMGMCAAAGGIAANGSFGGVALIVVLLSVGMGAMILLWLPPWPSWKSEGPMKTALFAPFVALIFLVAALFYRNLG